MWRGGQRPPQPLSRRGVVLAVQQQVLDGLHLPAAFCVRALVIFAVVGAVGCVGSALEAATNGACVGAAVQQAGATHQLRVATVRGEAVLEEVERCGRRMWPVVLARRALGDGRRGAAVALGDGQCVDLGLGGGHVPFLPLVAGRCSQDDAQAVVCGGLVQALHVSGKRPQPLSMAQRGH